MDRSYKQINVYKYECNIQVDMQNKDYEVSSNKSSGEFRVDVTLSILDEVLNEDDLNDKPYYMFVNNTGEIFESRISNGKATFNVNYYSFVAEIKFHADALCNKLAYFDKWYNSAIIADMGVGEESEYNPFNKYYKLNSDLVLEQIKYHANIYSIL